MENFFEQCFFKYYTTFYKNQYIRFVTDSVPKFTEILSLKNSKIGFLAEASIDLLWKGCP